MMPRFQGVVDADRCALRGWYHGRSGDPLRSGLLGILSAAEGLVALGVAGPYVAFTGTVEGACVLPPNWGVVLDRYRAECVALGLTVIDCPEIEDLVEVMLSAGGDCVVISDRELCLQPGECVEVLSPDGLVVVQKGSRPRAKGDHSKIHVLQPAGPSSGGTLRFVQELPE